MTKQVAENLNPIRISWLNRQGLLGGGFKSGAITWSSGGETKSSVGFTISTGGEEEYIKLRYTHTDNHSGEKTDLDYKIRLLSTSCNYGSKRYWFECPLSKDGKFCGRRVGTLFVLGKYYGCRHCGNIAYNSQMQTERYKGFISIPDIEQAKKEVKRWYYKGKPTKKHKKVVKMNEKFNWQMFKMSARLDARFKRIVDRDKK